MSFKLEIFYLEYLELIKTKILKAIRILYD